MFASWVDNFKPGSHLILLLSTYIASFWPKWFCDSLFISTVFHTADDLALLNFFLALFGPKKNPLSFVFS